MSRPTSKSICYVLSYRAPNYIRTTSLLAALQSIPELILYPAINKHKGPIRYLETLAHVLWIRFRWNPDIYFVGFRGHEIFLIIYPFIYNKTIIFDEFVSPYDSYVTERKTVHTNSITAKILYRLEHWILHHSDHITFETISNQTYYSQIFHLNQNQTTTIHLGVDTTLFKVKPKKIKNPNFRIFFYGTFLPLHGIKQIYQAASKLQSNPEINFTIIGSGSNPDINIYIDKFKELPNVSYHAWVELEKLPDYVNQAHLCLGGPYGNTPQSQRLITGKTLQFIAMAKPVIIGKSQETDIFTQKKSALLIEQGSDKQLIQMILWAYNNQPKLASIGHNAKLVYDKHFSNQKISDSLKLLINNIKS